MKSLTSNDESRLLMFLRELLVETGNWCRVSTARDFKTVSGRIDSEGLSFLTISLPAFAEDMIDALRYEQVESYHFAGFKRSRGKVLPQFLGGMLALIFDPVDGALLEEPSYDAIRGVRQICLAFAKIGLDCSDERKHKAVLKYLKCELEVREHDQLLTENAMTQKVKQFQRIGRLLFSRIFSDIDLQVYEGRYLSPRFKTEDGRGVISPILPKHGPGSTADKLFGNKKFEQFEWTTRLEEYFPFGENAFSSWTSYLSMADSNRLVFREPWNERPAKVELVPKTLKTPRIIAIEPTAMQYVQQGLMEAIREAIERDDILRPLISTVHQEPNQVLACLGSIDGSIATLDLSEASDRVSNQHVRLLLANHPHLMGGVDACRSRKADVPGYGVIHLAKFASMGSALCFPFESMVFLTLVFCGIEDVLKVPLTRTSIKKFLGKVRVYGDDICVPTDYAVSVMDCLDAFGIVVNLSKSFWTGKFRESCGKEYFNGHDVSITRVRELLPSSRKNPERLISTVSLRNQLFLSGYSDTVQFLDGLIERIIPFPKVLANSPIMGKLTYDGSFDATSWDSDLQRPLVKGAVVKVRNRSNSIDGYPALMKYFLKRSELPFASREHLLYSGRPVSVDIKTRLSSPV